MKYADGRAVPTCRVERQRQHRAKLEAEGYYEPEAVAERERKLQASREYNERIANIDTPKKRAKK